MITRQTAKRIKINHNDAADSVQRVPAQQQKASAFPVGALLKMRLGSSNHTTPPKRSILIHQDAVQLSTPQAVILQNQYSKKENYRPAAKVLIKSSTGTPTKIETPNGTQLSQSHSFKAVVFYDNASPADKERFEIKHSDRTVPNNEVKENSQLIKYQSIRITDDLIKSVKQERQKLGRRAISQNAVMAKSGINAKKAGATRYAQGFKGFPSDLKCEWLHLIAYFVLGKLSQRPDNLGCGSFHSNTDMIFIEQHLPRLARAYPDGFDLDVKAHFIKDTQLLDRIEYTITTKDFILPFEFNAQQQSASSLSFNLYISQLFEILIATDYQQHQPTKADRYPGLLFSKTEQASQQTNLRRKRLSFA